MRNSILRQDMRFYILMLPFLFVSSLTWGDPVRFSWEGQFADGTDFAITYRFDPDTARTQDVGSGTIYDQMFVDMQFFHNGSQRVAPFNATPSKVYIQNDLVCCGGQVDRYQATLEFTSSFWTPAGYFNRIFIYLEDRAISPALTTLFDDESLPTDIGALVGAPSAEAKFQLDGAPSVGFAITPVLNSPPTANAGTNVIVAVGETVRLSGEASTDDKETASQLAYGWVLTAQPNGSIAALNDAAVATPELMPDISGNYELELIVTDLEGTPSAPSSVTVTAEIDPAFIYEVTYTGSYQYEGNDALRTYISEGDNSWPTSFASGVIAALWDQYSHIYDGTNRIAITEYGVDRFDDSGKRRIVTTGDILYDDYIVDHVGHRGTGISDDGTLYFNVSASSPTQGRMWGLYSEKNGTIQNVLQTPVQVGGGHPLQWGHTASLSYNGLIVGSDNTTYEVTRSGYTFNRMQLGLYQVTGGVVVKIADTSDTFTVLGKSYSFLSFGEADIDDETGVIAFTAAWVDSFDHWHWGLLEKAPGESMVLLYDTGDPNDWFYHSYFQSIHRVGTTTYFSGRKRTGETGIFSSTDGELKMEASNLTGFGSLLAGTSCDDFDYCRTLVSTSGFDVSDGVLAFNANFFGYNRTTQERVYREGVLWQEGGSIRSIFPSGDEAGGVTFDWIWKPQFGALDGRSLVLEAGDEIESFYDVITGDRRQSGNNYIVLARFDSDRDTVADDLDNCPMRPNLAQSDTDGNGTGDLCEDTDLDSVADVDDNCPVFPNPAQIDTDSDSYGDGCDVCPIIEDNQADFDGDDIGDACDADVDGDGVDNLVDNCEFSPNATQNDIDVDSIGDACDVDIDGDGIANGVDGFLNGNTFVDESQTASVKFSDQNLGGVSFGEIASIGNLKLFIDDAGDSQAGLFLTTPAGTGTGRVKPCGFTGKDASVKFEQGTAMDITCGSIIVNVLSNRAELTLDNDVTINISQLTKARVEELGSEGFLVANEPESAFPVEMQLGDDITVTVPSSTTGVVEEPDEGQYVISNETTIVGAEPIVVEAEGKVFEYGAGDVGLPVLIDIKPDSTTNTINLGSNGNVPVAILSSDTFDATTVNPVTVSLASAPLKLKGKGTPMYSLKDVNGDGLIDFLVHVDTSSFQLSSTAETAKLQGETLDGTEIFGTDTILVVK